MPGEVSYDWSLTLLTLHVGEGSAGRYTPASCYVRRTQPFTRHLSAHLRQPTQVSTHSERVLLRLLIAGRLQDGVDERDRKTPVRLPTAHEQHRAQ